MSETFESRVDHYDYCKLYDIFESKCNCGFAEITQLRAALAEAQAEIERLKNPWRPIADAPRDGTPVDLIIQDDEFGSYRMTDCHWGKDDESHCCGEAGQYCDYCPDPSWLGWVDDHGNAIGVDCGYRPHEHQRITHYAPIPAPPSELHISSSEQGGEK